MAALEAATQLASVSERKEGSRSHAETRSARSSFSSPRPPRLRVNPLRPQTRAHWVAGSSPAMVMVGQLNTN